VPGRAQFVDECGQALDPTRAQHDVVTGVGEVTGSRLADAAAGAGDEDDLPAGWKSRCLS